MNAVEKARIYRKTRDELREEVLKFSPASAEFFLRLYENGGRNVLGTVKRMRVGILSAALFHARKLNE